MRFCPEPIGIVRSPFTDKFGIPRQPGLVPAAQSRVVLLPPYDREEAFDGIDGFSHVWLIFVFHDDCLGEPWRPTVRPPKLGGRKRVGVFASRAPYRPNPIGISAVEHLGLRRDAGGLSLGVRGADLMDGTPILDIKPYVPYADSIAQSRPGFSAAPEAIDRPVAFEPRALEQIRIADPEGWLELQDLIRQVLAQDPRPGYMDRYPERDRFALRLYDLEVRWRIQGGTAVVDWVGPAQSPPAGTPSNGIP